MSFRSSGLTLPNGDCRRPRPPPNGLPPPPPNGFAPGSVVPKRSYWARFCFVAEYVVGALHFLEAGFGLLVAGVAVGMVLAGQLAVGFFEIGFGGVALDAEGFIEIAGHDRSTGRGAAA